jgi:hypothetical protein
MACQRRKPEEHRTVATVVTDLAARQFRGSLG